MQQETVRRPATMDRLRRVFNDAAGRLSLAGPEPGLELAGRFGVRRFFERHLTNDPEVQQSPWLARARAMRKEARDLTRILADAGIRHFFYKGIALVGRFYRIEERQLADIDLQVDPAGKNAALAALYARGYGELGGVEDARPGITMTRGDILLDVHWGVEALQRVVPGDAVAVPAAVWSGIETQGGLPGSQDEHHAALVLHHLARHDLDHIRGLLDFVFLWDAIPHQGGRELTEMARRLGVGRLLTAAGRVLVDQLGLYPLRGVPLTPDGWRAQALVTRLRLRRRLEAAARTEARGPAHMAVTRGRAWLRYLLADRATLGTLAADLRASVRR